MVNVRFGIPLFFLIGHQHISNSAFGINNPIVSLTLFFLLLSSMCLFLITNNNLGYSKFTAVLSLSIFIGLWLVNPTLYKDLSNLYINCFITFYIVSQGGFLALKSQLKFLVVVSALLCLFQIWGISPLFHEWNSQFLEERAGHIVRNIEVQNIMHADFRNAEHYDSRQVRAQGIFHSSALLSGIFVMYIAFIFCGIYNSQKNYVLIPFLCLFSGSKLVLLTTVLFLIVVIFFRRVSLKEIAILIISSIFAILIHKWLFYSLLDFQFNTDILWYSFDVRMKLYEWEPIDFTSFLPDAYMILGLGFCIFLMKKVFLVRVNADKVCYFLILIIAVSSAYFSTPHVGNLLIGWVYFPAFFVSNMFLMKKAKKTLGTKKGFL